MNAITCRLKVGMKFDQYRAQVELNEMVHEKGKIFEGKMMSVLAFSPPTPPPPPSPAIFRHLRDFSPH